MTLQDPSDISRMRISDADRDLAASVLSEALAQGRLTAEEHSERLDTIYAAKTQAEILPVVSDLPGATAALAQGTLSGVTGVGAIAVTGGRTRIVAVFSAITRKGSWQVPAAVETISVLADARLDLRHAVLPAREIKIRAICVLGGVEITVPPEMHVVDNGIALLGGREIPPDSAESAHPDAPVLRVSGISILGGISVRRRPRSGEIGSGR